MKYALVYIKKFDPSDHLLEYINKKIREFLLHTKVGKLDFMFFSA